METEMDWPVCDAEPYRSFRACFNCRFKDNIKECPITAEKNGNTKEFQHPNCSSEKYTATMADNDVRLDHSCALHQYAAGPGDTPVCEMIKRFSQVPASCEACSEEYGLEGPPCVD